MGQENASEASGKVFHIATQVDLVGVQVAVSSGVCVRRFPSLDRTPEMVSLETLTSGGLVAIYAWIKMEIKLKAQSLR